MRRVERLWYSHSAAHFALLPLSSLFAAIVALRRRLYRCGLLRSQRLPRPVIVVGNLTVGGSGKTPFTLWLVDFLRSHGRRPGIVSRGYGGTQRAPTRVTAADDPARVGDEPILMAQRTGVPVWIGAMRADAALALLAAHPECDVIVADDGLQHYALQRDVEIVIVDGVRGFGNGCLLPAGPLREPVRRLHQVDLVVVNGGHGLPQDVPGGAAHMRLAGDVAYRLDDPTQHVGIASFAAAPVHALAGIADPKRFFRHLEAFGLTVIRHPYPDHHAFSRADLALPGEGAILMTEKDAVKCRAYASPRCWVMPVTATVEATAGALILARLARKDV